MPSSPNLATRRRDMTDADDGRRSAPRKLTARFSQVVEGLTGPFRKQTSALPAEATKDRPPRRVYQSPAGGAARVEKLQQAASAADGSDAADKRGKSAADENGTGIITATVAVLLTTAWVVATASLVRQVVTARASR